METEEPSDQLPEEGAESYTPEDDDKPSGSGDTSAGGSDKGDDDAGTATGNPANAG
jgi:hypothetical protein